MTTSKLSRAALLAGLCLALATPGAQAKLYRWVDDQGAVHYTDTPPPAAAGKKGSTLDESGRVIEQHDPAAEKAQAEAQKREEAARAAAEKQREEEARRDRALLQTFTTVRDLEVVRDDRIAAFDSTIKLGEDRLGRQRATLEGLEQRGKQLTDQGKPVPDNLAKQIESARATVADTEKYLDGQRKERTETAQRFESDIARFKELKGLDKKAP